jgi:lysophospholipase L1-like esterase
MDSVVNNIEGNVSAMMDLAQKAGIKFILCSILPTNMDYLKTGELANEMICKANEKLKAAAEAKNAIYVDYHTSFADTDGRTLKDGFAYDGLHPNVLGFNRMAEILRNTLEEYGIEI